MVEIIADTKEIEQHLNNLVTGVENAGGFLNPHLRICCRDKNLTIEADESVQLGRSLISLPRTATLPLAQMNLQVEGNDIQLRATGEMSAEQVKLAEAMVAIYNLTSKIAAHRECATDLLAYTDPDLLRRLTSDVFVARCLEQDETSFVLRSFLRGREFDHPSSQDDAAPNLVINPVIDFFNHHPLATSFGNDHGRTFVTRFSADASGAECFVRYGQHDDHMMLVGYAYAETKTPFVISQDMEIELPGIGTLVIHRRPELAHNFSAIPAQLRGAEPFLSAMKFDPEKRRLEIGCLHIPPATMPHALRRILRFSIRGMKEGLRGRKLSEAVKSAEGQVVARNRAFYADLLQDLESYTLKPGTELIVDNIKTVAASQLAKINAYVLG